MHPVLFTFGDHVVGTHNFFIALGVIAAALLFAHDARRRGELTEQMVWIVAGALVGGAIGAKLSAMLGTIGDVNQPSMRVVILHGGRSIIGGIIGGYLGVLAAKKFVRHPRKTGDLFAAPLALGMAVGRWGCFFSELPGTPTTLPWGIRLDALSVARLPDCPAYCGTSALHPSILYEIVFLAVMVCVIRFSWSRKPMFRDRLLKLYLLCYGVFRFLVEFVRGHDVFWHGLTRAQVFLIPVVLGLAIHLFRELSNDVGHGTSNRPDSPVRDGVLPTMP